MSRRDMVIDSLKFAREVAELDGPIVPGELPRLADVLFDQEGELLFSLTGGKDQSGKPGLDLRVGGRLNVRCQRCLGALSFPVQVRKWLALISQGEEWPEEDLETDETDALAADSAMDVISLVEDEILLALPIAPRHEACSPPEHREGAAAASPFASLAQLKRDGRNE